MMLNDIELRVVNIIKKNFDQPELLNEINLNDSLDSYGFNSIKFIKIVVDLENEFAIEFDDEELNMDTFSTLNDVVQRITQKVETEKK
jgi:acyl carrier protein